MGSTRKQLSGQIMSEIFQPFEDFVITLKRPLLKEESTFEGARNVHLFSYLFLDLLD